MSESLPPRTSAPEPPAKPGMQAEDGLVLAGRLEDSSFADLMSSLGRNKETALLSLQREATKKVVYVQEGRVVFASSTDADERLGECMLREGMITIAQYDESVRQIRPGKRQGTILVELGYIAPAELVKGVKLQVEQIVLNLFSWRTGHYRAEIHEFDTRDIITLNISTENIVFSGIKLGAGWSQVLRGLSGTLDTVLDRAADADTRLYKLDLTDDETHVCSLANGRLSVGQICGMSYLSNYSTCLTLWALTCCGILRVVTAKDAETLFREQVAEFELIEIRDKVEAFNTVLRPACEAVAASKGEGASAFLEAALAELIDEHYDVLREVTLERGGVDAELVVENVMNVDPGHRRRLVEKALDELLVTLLLKIKLEISADLEKRLAEQASRLRRR